jgi:hypothetical protein
MWNHIQPVGALNQRQGVKCVIYGRAKSGKTRLLATAPAPLILSSERGTLSLGNANLPVIEVPTLTQLEYVHTWLLSDPKAQQTFGTVCLDSATDLFEKYAREERAKAGKDSFAAWGRVGTKAWEIFTKFRDLPFYNVVLICHQEYDKDDTGTMFNMPSVPGKETMKSLPYWFDGVYQMVSETNDQGQFRNMLRCIGNNINFAGDRSGKLAMWEPSDLARLFAKITN